MPRETVYVGSNAGGLPRYVWDDNTQLSDAVANFGNTLVQTPMQVNAIKRQRDEDAISAAFRGREADRADRALSMQDAWHQADDQRQQQAVTTANMWHGQEVAARNSAAQNQAKHQQVADANAANATFLKGANDSANGISHDWQATLKNGIDQQNATANMIRAVKDHMATPHTGLAQHGLTENAALGVAMDIARSEAGHGKKVDPARVMALRDQLMHGNQPTQAGRGTVLRDVPPEMQNAAKTGQLPYPIDTPSQPMWRGADNPPPAPQWVQDQRNVQQAWQGQQPDPASDAVYRADLNNAGAANVPPTPEAAQHQAYLDQAIAHAPTPEHQQKLLAIQAAYQNPRDPNHVAAVTAIKALYDSAAQQQNAAPPPPGFMQIMSGAWGGGFGP